MRTIVATVLMTASLLLLGAGPTLAASTCDGDRYKAGDRHAKCRHAALIRYRNVPDKYFAAVAKCTTKYVDSWSKIEADFAGTGNACDSPRFVDNLDGTVTDTLTGLQWEKKTNDSSVHDRQNTYTWSVTAGPADGTAFTSFLSALNASGSCFAGNCDWRLPTPAELQTILLAPYPCGVPICVDQSVFGPGFGFPYWSSMTSADDATEAWYTVFVTGAELRGAKSANYAVRAVRAGL